MIHELSPSVKLLEKQLVNIYIPRCISINHFAVRENSVYIQRISVDPSDLGYT